MPRPPKKSGKASNRRAPASESEVVAGTAAEAFRPRAAPIDLGMPGMNGFEVAERLRAAHNPEALEELLSRRAR